MKFINLLTHLQKIKSHIGIILAFITLMAAFFIVIANHISDKPLNKTVLFLSHWQSEDGVREGLEAIIKRYEKLHPNIKITQQFIPIRAYKQWGVTQMIGEQMPDIMQIGVFEPIYLARYFEPLSSHIEGVNPYNTDDLSTSWSGTFIDSMEGQFNSSLQDYYGVPFSAFTWGVYYNKSIFESLNITPPQRFRQWIDISRKIKQANIYSAILYPGGDTKRYPSIINRFSAMLLSSFEGSLDFNRDGRLQADEYFLAYEKGLIDFKTEQWLAPIKAFHEFGSYCQSGFVGMDIEQSKFMFFQKQGATIPEGLWEARTMFENAENFEVGVFLFPSIDSNDPRYGRFFDGPFNEAMTGAIGFPLGISLKGKNKDIALDFLKFATSKANNKIFNDHAYWIPVINGVAPREKLRELTPKNYGYFACDFPDTPYYSGTSGQTTFNQLIQLYLNGRYNFDEFIGIYSEKYRDIMLSAWRKKIVNQQINTQIQAGRVWRFRLNSDLNKSDSVTKAKERSKLKAALLKEIQTQLEPMNRKLLLKDIGVEIGD